MKNTYYIVLNDEYLKEAQDLVIALKTSTRLLYQSTGFLWFPRVILAAFAVWMADTGEWPTAIFAAALAIVTFLTPILKRRSLARARQPADRIKGTQLTISLDDSGVDTSGAFSTGQIQWAGILQALVYPQGILLKVTPRLYLWLPDRLVTGGSPAEARQLVKDRVKESVTKT